MPRKGALIIELKLIKNEKERAEIKTLFERYKAQINEELVQMNKTWGFLVILDTINRKSYSLSDIENYFYPDVLKGGYMADKENDLAPRYVSVQMGVRAEWRFS